jgi:light-regulated signal transduction histidine kinase (bacteriophytochrome)
MPMPPDHSQQGADGGRWFAAEEELQSFSYIVSHDLAASFRHVSEFSRLLLGELAEDLTVRQQSHATHIRAATDNCQAMMEQLLAYSRVQQKTLDKVWQDANTSFDLPILQLMARAAAEGAELHIEPLGEVCADTALLVLAFRLLMDNAVKFRRPDVRPRIAVRPAHDDLMWRMQITDNGIGVDPAYREKAFQMFHRLHGEDAFPGVGAGLAICRRIARRHDGGLTFLDCAEGACIELALPRSGHPLN